MQMSAQIIDQFRPFLIEELQKEVPEALLRLNILTQQEYERISFYDEREYRITLLLDIILSSKTKDKQNEFTSYIIKHYEWICTEGKAMNDARTNFEELKTTLDDGEVPALPFRHVARKEETMELFKKLQNLNRNEYVVVHGMRGCGKSTLVSSTFYEFPSLVRSRFQEKIFWVPIGHEAEELTVLLDLCGRLTSFHTIQPLPVDSISAKRYLKDRFNREENLDCLLILDDVPSASFINALDVGCKILVTTDDISVMNLCKKRFYPISVSEGFSEDQTLQLFMDSTECDKLPPCAKNIHAICKGFPASIALISSQLAEHKEEVNANSDRWRIYESELKKAGIRAAIGRYDQYRYQQVASFYRAIGMTIDGLDKEFKKMYNKLALFMEDVNIRPEVLCILWDKRKEDVINIMSEFEKKFLVRKMWHTSKKTYIYCVHDLHLGYLKGLLTDTEKKQLHRTFIDSYKQKYGNDFHNFPVDENYILLYLGYHLKEAGMIEEFPDLYLNLIFIEKKIVHYGAADLLFDFKKYKKEIAHDEANSKKYEDFTHFIRRVAAPCRSISNSDLIQFGLCESKDSAVYRAALELKNQPNRFKHFEMETRAPVENSPPSVYADRDEIVRAVFTHSGDILVANANGVIRRMHISENHLSSTKTFQGHTARVSLLQVKNHTYFLSASDDATVRVWDANGSCGGGGGDFANRRTPSPQIKQDEWVDPWPKGRSTGERAVAVLEHDLPIKCAQFSNSQTNFHIVTVDVHGQLRVYVSAISKDDNEIELTYQLETSVQTNRRDITSCSFSNNESVVLYSCANGDVCLHNSRSGDLINQVDLENCHVKSLIIIPETQQINAIVLGARDFYLYKIEPSGNDQNFTLNAKVKSASSYGRKTDYVCAAVSSDGKLVAIATTNYSIFIYDTVSGDELMKFNESNGKISNISWSFKNHILLTTYEHSKIMKTWQLDDELINNSVKLQQHTFDAAWFSNDVDDIMCVAVALDNKNQMNVFFNEDPQNELNPTSEKILQVAVCPLDGDIVYAQEGKIFHLETNDWTERMILTCPQCSFVNMKVFGKKVRTTSGDLLLKTTVLVLYGDEANDEFSLIGWSKCVTEDSEKVVESEVAFKPLPQAVIKDYVADLENNALYVVTIDHMFHVYDLSNGKCKRTEDLSSYALDEGLEKVTYCDISANFEYIVTGNEKQYFLRSISGHSGSKQWATDVSVRHIGKSKISPNAKYLVVGFDNSNIEIFNVERFSNVHPIKMDRGYKFCPGSVQDISWSPSSDQFIVIFDREVSLYKMFEDGVELYANLYISVDKFISNPSFSKSSTVDSSGHFHIFKHQF